MNIFGGKGGAVPASQTLTGIAKIGLSLNSASDPIKAGIWEQASRVFQSSNERGMLVK